MLTSSLFRILGRDTGCVEYMSLRVRLDTAYFAENNNKKNCWLLFTLKNGVHMLDALFMSHEQCTRRWSKKKKGLKCKTSKRGRDPNAH